MKSRKIQSDIVRRLGEFCREHRLFSPSERVLVAVSGGPDSVALLDLLREIAPGRGLRIVVAHFDHCLRGEESRRDALWVKRLAVRWGFPCVLGRADVRARAKKEKRSLETAARQARYDFLTSSARRRGIRKIVLGHQADDQAETVLMRLLRGTGPEGLGGMGPSAAWGGLVLIRPLLGFWRKEIVAYLREKGLDFRVDPSNRDVTYTRNRIRLRLLPYLEKHYNPRIREILVHLARLEREREELIPLPGKPCPPSRRAGMNRGSGCRPMNWGAKFRYHGLARPRRGGHPSTGSLRLRSGPAAGSRAKSRDARGGSISPGRRRSGESAPARPRREREVDLKRLAAAPAAVRGRFLKEIVAAAGAPSIDRRHFRALEKLLHGGNGKEVCLPGNLIVRVEAGRLIVGPRRKAPPARPYAYKIPVPGETAVKEAGLRIIARRLLASPRRLRPRKKSGFEKHWPGGALRGAARELFDLKKIALPLTVRSRRPGDRFRPLGPGGSRKVKEIFIDEKVPPAAREVIPLVTDGKKVIWICGYRPSEECRLNKNTRAVLELRAIPLR